MKQHNTAFSRMKQLGCLLLLVQAVFAQGYDDPLTIQGIDHITPPSAASRGAGGTTVCALNNVGLMFTNPAALQSLTGIQLSLCGVHQDTKAAQVQRYAPLM